MQAETKKFGAKADPVYIGLQVALDVAPVIAQDAKAKMITHPADLHVDQTK
jgi:hypothetical protein